MTDCTICPRSCHADRENGQLGYCGVDDRIRVARYAPHFWEEPPLSGTRGAGAIFFSGCSLRCVYCQNHDLSHGGYGTVVSDDRLCDIILELRDKNVHCIDLVTPTHYADRLIPILSKIKPMLGIPIVWNSGGYEKLDTLRRLEGLVDVYLPDIKYASSELASKYSDAPDYPDVAFAALSEMHRQVGKSIFDSEGMIKTGVIVRHLVLPGSRKDSVKVLDLISKTVPTADIKLSLMSQYTPDFAADSSFNELRRRVTSFEYGTVLSHAEALGFDGYFQERSSADRRFTPDFMEQQEEKK